MSEAMKNETVSVTFDDTVADHLAVAHCIPARKA